MSSLFRGKYRNESFRLNGHDYSSGGRYFVTICTNGMISYFGNISVGKMVLSETGQIANETWYELPEHFPYLSLDEFVVMPNHIHGIIIIEPLHVVGTLDVGTLDVVGTLHATSPRPPPPPPPPQQPKQQNPDKNKFMSSISPKPGSLPAVIRSYKSAVSKTVHLTDPDFSWQSRYYDHLIRSDQEMSRIRKYIINNPGKWDH
jgi:REP element-mobilizing transposase RayT